MLTVTGVHKKYGDLHVLKGVDVTIQSGEIVSIVGPSGAGKSTLLHIMGTLDQADQGVLTVDAGNLSALNGNQLAAFRNSKVGFIFQFHNLLPEFTSEEYVRIPGVIAGRGEKELRKRAGDWAVLLGIQARLQHKPSELSGA